MSEQGTDIRESTPNYRGFFARCIASWVDGILLLVITFPMLWLIYGAAYFESEDMVMGVGDVLITYVLPLVATIGFWVYKSATPGKMCIKAKIVDATTGHAITPKQAIIRYIGYFISALPFFLGFLWVIWDSKKQGWHDKIAGTVVVHRDA